MSDFVHIKAIMLPLSKEHFEIVDNALEGDLKRFKKQKCGFKVTAMSSAGNKINYYLQYVLEENRDNSGEFGCSRYLAPFEKAYWYQKFYQFLSVLAKENALTVRSVLDVEKIKYVDYSFFNATDSDDFYTNSIYNVDTVKMDKKASELSAYV